jgi:hypothetical protein
VHTVVDVPIAQEQFEEKRTKRTGISSLLVLRSTGLIRGCFFAELFAIQNVQNHTLNILQSWRFFGS